MTSIAIVEDNQTVRETLRDWIESAPGHRCVCLCASAKEARVAIPRQQPDVVLMDINLPGGESGIACIARLKNQMPNLQVIVVTVYKDQDLIFQALQAGACGYLLKRSSREEILRAIAEVQTGGAPMTGEIARMLIGSFQKPLHKQDPAGLSSREMEILMLLAKGLANKEIADRLALSAYTVSNHVRHIYEKLHVHCRAEAVTKYIHDRRSPTTGPL